MAGNLKSDFDTNQYFDDIFDDWMIKSMKSYRNLHMFELQHPTQVIEWIDNDAICVAGCKDGSRNELIELVIPDKLIEDIHNEGSGRDRDFQVRSGGFSQDAIYQLKHIPKSRVLVTSGPPDNSANIWQLGSEHTSIIQNTQTIKSKVESPHHCYLDTHTDYSNGFIMGAVLGDIQCVDVETGKTTYSSDVKSIERLCGVKLIDTNTCVACTSESGDIHVIDLRSSTNSQSNQGTQLCQDSASRTCHNESEQSKNGTSQSELPTEKVVTDTDLSKQMDKNQTKVWTIDVQKTPSDQTYDRDKGERSKFETEERHIFRLKSGSQIVVNDIRNLSTPLITTTLKLPQHTVGEYVSIQTSSGRPSYISVSGIDDKVYIYDIMNAMETESSKLDSIEPIFVHEGHVTTDSTNQNTVVWVHTWHPWKEHLLMSAGSDGSLHAWDWVIPKD